MTLIQRVQRWLGIERMEQEMGKLKNTVDSVVASEAALEARVTAHEENLKSISAQLQAQIDALKNGEVNTNEAAATLESLKTRIDNFDPDTTPPA